MDDGWRPPESFDAYQRVRPLGRGRAGSVYAAHDAELDRPVALKFIGETATDPAAKERLLAEARAVARVHHPNVAVLYRVGEVDRHAFLVSELVTGQSLDRLERPLSSERAYAVALGLARGLAAAHRRGVLHRDLKPANAVLGDDGEVKLIDFGLALRAGTAAAPSGTPLYAAPELWQGDVATARSDVYALGAVLYELCSGQPPHPVTELPKLALRAQTADVPALASVQPGVDRELASLVDRCLSRDPALRFESADALRETLEQLRAHRSDAAIPGNVYLGLSAFQAEHQALFFGRDADVRAVLERLRADAMVLVSGASGVGKSSLCRCGVMPRVDAGALGGGRGFHSEVLVPGRAPLRALGAALAHTLGTDAAAATLALDRPAELARSLSARLGAASGLLLCLDQLEELVTLGESAEAERAADLLAYLLDHVAGLKVLGAVRGDFFTALAALSSFGERAARAFFVLQPLSARGTREAIIGPARALGFSFESEAMVDGLVEATSRAEGGLPLLEFTLAELWEGRDERRRVIPSAALEAIGGVVGALARHADAVVARLPADDGAAARRLLCRLATQEGTRVRRARSELTTDDPAAARALDALVRGRLLLARESEAGEPSCEIAHEALIRGWPALRRWLVEDVDARVVRERVERASAEWVRLQRRTEALWSAPQLSDIEGLGPAALGERERAFLDASRRAVRRSRLLRRATLAAVPLLLAGMYGAVTLRQRLELAGEVRRRLEAAAETASAARAQTVELERAEAEALALFDVQKMDDAERAWTQVLAQREAVRRLFSEATQKAQAALALDAAQAKARALIAQLMYERALLAERANEPAQVNDLLGWLELYDADGRWRKSWSEPATVRLTTRPPDARAVLAPFERRPDGHRALGASQAASAVPVSLAPGSYLLIASAPGYQEVRLPFVVGRAEALELTVALPRASDVPEGFVYVPEGRFLFGAVDNELRRQYYGHAPIHPTRTGPFLIAKLETTFADWLEFLRALPPAERAAHTPKVAQGAIRGGLELTAEPDGRYRLSLTPTVRTYVAREGEPITYGKRDRRVSQDWRRFPVSGITRADALAYLLWLRESGRLSTARLCTEAEWERAARGADDRLYPSGDLLQLDDADFDDAYGREPLGFGPDEVGSHPGGDSPFTVHDLSGNVWEFVDSSLGPTPNVIRGGGFYQDRITSRSVNREPVELSLHNPNVGMRVCADAR